MKSQSNFNISHHAASVLPESNKDCSGGWLTAIREQGREGLNTYLSFICRHLPLLSRLHPVLNSPLFVSQSKKTPNKRNPTLQGLESKEEKEKKKKRITWPKFVTTSCNVCHKGDKENNFSRKRQAYAARIDTWERLPWRPLSITHVATPFRKHSRPGQNVICHADKKKVCSCHLRSHLHNQDLCHKKFSG